MTKHLRVNDMRDVVKKNVLFMIVPFIVMVIFIVAFSSELSNYSNKIAEGTIIDKYYDSGDTRITASDNRIEGRSIPPRYMICIEGDKNGEKVRYWFEVTEDEYNNYKIGDRYKR